jgi:ParB/RepB/Spo0J family partition protein
MKTLKVSEIIIGENFSREELGDCRSLANSIAALGLLSPVVVNKDNVLVAGFRRFHVVSQILNWQEIPVVVIGEEVNAGLANLQENLERRDLTFFEEAQAIRRLFPGATDLQVADALNQSRSWARLRLRFWDLPPEIIELARKGKLPISKIAILVSSKNPQELCDKILNTDLNEAKIAAGHSERPSRKKIQQTLTECINRGLHDIAQAFRYSIGDMTEEEFWDSVDKGE